MVKLLLGVWLALAPQNTTSLQGTLKRSGTSEPIGGVEITLRATSNSQGGQAVTTTDAAGRFTFENVPFGKYSLRANRQGYFTYPDGYELPNQIASITIDSPQTQQVTIDLTPGATISGRITDPQGNPLPDVSVSAAQLTYEEGRRAFAAGTIPKKTNDRGEFRLFWLPPGEYYIRAEYTGPSAGNLARRAYYPGTVDSNVASPLTIRGGESLDGLNFALPVANNVRISGRVRTYGPLPSAGAIRTFYLLPRDGRPAELYPLEFTNTVQPQLGATTVDFAIDVRGIAAGTYDLAPFFLDGGSFNTGRTTIQLGDRDIENVSAIISPNINVTGRVTTKDSLVYEKWRAINMELRSRDVAVPLTGRSGTASFKPDGTFSISKVVEGRYQLYIGAAPGSIPSDLYIASVRQAGLDLQDEGTIEVRDGMPALEITLSTGAGRIEGTVESAIGGVPTRADVVLVPQLSRRQNVMYYDRTTVDAKGHFSFSGIAPGEYKVFAFEQLADSAERNPQFLARYETLGQSVTIDTGAAKEMRVRILRN